MELLSLGEALDGRDLTTFDKCGERKARLHALAVHEDRAGAALAKTTALLRTREMQVLAEAIEQRRARIES
jgi:hypothetical protein